MNEADKLFLERLTLFVDENIDQSSLTSNTLAREFHFSQRHVNLKVKTTTGVDTTHFIRSRRIAQACHLLTHTDLPISRIAEECGISSANYFSRIFKMEIGMTPFEYRIKMS